jgi:hypothetical protein
VCVRTAKVRYTWMTGVRDTVLPACVYYIEIKFNSVRSDDNALPSISYWTVQISRRNAAVSRQEVGC